MQIRLARESDLESAAQLWFDRLALLQQTGSFIRPLPNAVDRWRSIAKTWIISEEHAFILASDQETVLGFIVVAARDGPAGLEPARLGMVVDMAIDLHQARHGLSGRLLEHAKEWLRSMDIEYLAVDAPARYPLEEEFWRARGAKLHSKAYWLQI